MKKTILYTLLLLPFFIYCQSNIDELLTNYKTALYDFTSNNGDPDAYASIVLSFSGEDSQGSHVYDFDQSNDKHKIGIIGNYLMELEITLSQKPVSLEFIEDKTYKLPCSGYCGGKKLNYYIIEKLVNNKKVEEVVGFDVTNSKLSIDFVVMKDSKLDCEIPFQCNSSESNDEANQITQTTKKAKQFYRQKDYINAKKQYQWVYQKTKDDTLLDIINTCNELIGLDGFKNEINSLISKEKYTLALNQLKSIPKQFLALGETEQWVDDKKQLCLTKSFQQIKEKIDHKIAQGEIYQAKDLLAKINEDFYMKSEIKSWKIEKENEVKTLIRKWEHERIYKNAKLYYEKGMYNKSLSELEKITGSEFVDNNEINILKEKCKDGDPQYVQKLLKEAYSKAVKSKKNWLYTYKIYKKYEYTGFLTGDNYFFMMKMNLPSNYNNIGKKVGYKRSHCKDFAKKYFYKAKRHRYNKEKLDFFETQIFTSNIKNYKH